MSEHSTHTRLRTSKGSVLAIGLTALALVLSTSTMADAAAGDPWVLGSANSSGTTTYLNWNKAENTIPQASLVVHGGDVAAVFSNAQYWFDNYPTGLTGVAGYGNDVGGFFFGVDSGVQAKGWYEGVHAEATESEGVGVRAVGEYGVSAAGDVVGVSASGETAVNASGDVVGLSASAPTAIQASGGVSFSTAGLATVAKGAKAVTVPAGVDVGPQTKVLATVQSAGGQLLRVRRNATADTITIILTKAASQKVTVAYFVLL